MNYFRQAKKIVSWGVCMDHVQERQSNLELLRMICAVFVIILHYNNPSMGGAFAVAQGFTKIGLFFAEAVSVCAVDIFVLISGYFLSQKRYIDLIKPFKIISQVLIFQVAFYFLAIVLKFKEFSILKMLEMMILPENWYVVLYVSLLLVSPYINILLNRLFEMGGVKKFIIVLIFLFSFYPTVIDILFVIRGKEILGLSSIGMYGSQSGYTIVNFCLLYIIGAVIKQIQDKIIIPVKPLVLLFLGIVCFQFLWNYFEYSLIGRFTAEEYCNPLVISEAVVLFIIFLKINIQSKIINDLAKGVFTVYLVHGNFLHFIRIDEFVTKGQLIAFIHLMASIVVIYLIGWIINIVYEYFTHPIWKIIDKKWKKHRKIEVSLM